MDTVLYIGFLSLNEIRVFGYEWNELMILFLWVSIVGFVNIRAVSLFLQFVFDKGSHL